jgi:hypothetical protein
MNFEEAMSAAARAADESVSLIMGDYQAGHLTDEDDISPALIGSLKTKFSSQIGGLTWSASIARHHRGVAAEEKRTGADIVIHVKLDTPLRTYSKGVLIQARRAEPNALMSPTALTGLVRQCNDMLAISPSSFVFNYLKG